MKTIFDSSLFPFVLMGFMLFVFIDVCWCQTGFFYQMVFVAFHSNTTGATSETGTDFPSRAPKFSPNF